MGVVEDVLNSGFYEIKCKDGGFYLEGENGLSMEFWLVDEIYKFHKKNRDKLQKHNAEKIKNKISRKICDEVENVESVESAESVEISSNNTNVERVKNKNERKSYIYLLECGGNYKIGVSGNVQNRIKQLETTPAPIHLICNSKKILNAYSKERELHRLYKRHRIKGEWFEFNDKDLEIVKEKILSL